jgi:polyhydroxyalkanoate synthesis regulator phasin
MYAKGLNNQADASITNAAKTEQADAPQKELARLQKAADDLETTRQSNIKAFRP